MANRDTECDWYYVCLEAAAKKDVDFCCDPCERVSLLSVPGGKGPPMKPIGELKGKQRPYRKKIWLDLYKYPELMEYIKTEARKALRTNNAQIIYMLWKYLSNVKDGTWE